MVDNKPKQSQKRRHCTPDLPAKRRLVDPTPAQEKPPQSAQRRVVLPHTSSNELLICLGLFLQQRCYKMKHLSAIEPLCWLRQIDNDLLIQQWQREPFISSGSVVFLYMLCRDLISPEIDSVEELKASLLTCFYICFCYIGCELSYPLEPFLVESSQKAFWDRCLCYIGQMSYKMMTIYDDRQNYSTLLAELKAVGREGSGLREGYFIMVDNRPKHSQKRRHCTPDLPAKRRLVDPTPAQEKPPQLAQRRVVLPHTSSNELLRCLGLFLQQRCCKMKHLSAIEPLCWLRQIDNDLLIQQWQREPFICSGSVVFLYMLCRDLISPEIDSMEELKASLLTCFYICFCYIGCELSYPLEPFLVESSQKAFWDRCLCYIGQMSDKMMTINDDRQYYSTMLAELKAVGREGSEPREGYFIMVDNKPKKSQKRRHCTPDLPAKRRLVDPTPAQEKPPQSVQRCVVLPHTSSNELLICLGLFLQQRCYKMKHLSAIEALCWLRQIDNDLLIQHWQREPFISSGSVVFLYMLCRDLISPEIDSVEELKASLLTCFYICFCYIGCELSYPLEPFLVESSQKTFWDRCVCYIGQMSDKMMTINDDRQYYSTLLAELKAVGREGSGLREVYFIMVDNKPKQSQKRRHCTPDLPAKRRLVDPTPAQEKPPQSAQRRVVLPHTSSNELLRCLGLFLQQRCYKMKHLSAIEPLCWLRQIDNDLLIQQWQREPFISSGSVVFLYMLCRDLISPNIDRMEELKASLLTCFYICFCYIGCELSYPLEPFLVESSQKAFWDRCVCYIGQMSDKMMTINDDRKYYSTLLAELKAVGREGSGLREGYFIMVDNKPKQSQKRHHCTPDLPAKRRLVDPTPAQEKPPQSAQRRVVLPHTSSNELLRCLGLFLQQRCYKMKHLSAIEPLCWLRQIDNHLLIQQWQREPFISSGSVVFLYMLCRDLISPEIDSVEELKASLLTCFYICFCYIGCELSYPLEPFLVESSQKAFWDRCVCYIGQMSDKMMTIYDDCQYYSTLLAELKAVGRED